MKWFLYFLLSLACLESGEFRLIDGRDFPKIGMFAFANQILGQLSIYESQSPVAIDGLSVDLSTFGLYYDPAYGPNWWNYYFEPISIGNVEPSNTVSLPKKLYFQAFKKRRKLTRIQAAQIVKKYIHVKEPILHKVEQFISYYFNDAFTIGVHYRGTDKSSEASVVPYDKVFQTILQHVPSERPWQIFVATDELSFLRAIQNQFPGRVIACDVLRSEGSVGVHFLDYEGYKKGEEALIDALLLSRCHLLIRTSSNLSLWSTYFNPELPTILLNASFRSHLNKDPE